MVLKHVLDERLPVGVGEGEPLRVHGVQVVAPLELRGLHHRQLEHLPPQQVGQVHLGVVVELLLMWGSL